MKPCLLIAIAPLAAMLVCAPVAAAGWPSAKVGPQAVWDAASDAALRSRFIPMQLIVPGVWDGAHRITLPAARGQDAEETVWSGPQDWRNPYTGQTITVYDRRRSNRREGLVEQKMTVRSDGTAIGRVYDSRFGGSVCEQEAKFPLGIWAQAEVRTYNYVCLASQDGKVVQRRRVARITIEELDYDYHGIAHSLRFAWRYTDADNGEVLDHRTYIFSPGLGMTGHARK